MPTVVQNSNYNRIVAFQKQVTFTPRLLLADLKGGVGRVSDEGILYDERPTDTESTWSDQLWDSTKLEVTSAEALNPEPLPVENRNEPEEEARDSPNYHENKSWADYFSSVFHPRTLTIIKEYSHNNTNQPFDVFTYGRNLWSTEHFSDDFSDRIRSYVEECNLMQGFQVRAYALLYSTSR